MSAVATTDAGNLKVAQIKAVNGEFAEVCKKLQEHYDNLQKKIYLGSEEDIFKIFREILMKSRDRVVIDVENFDAFRQKFVDLLTIVGSKYVFENASKDRVKDVLGEHSNDIFDNTFRTSFFQRIDDVLKKSNELADQGKFGESIDTYVTAICLYEAKIKNEIRYYRGSNLSIGEMLKRWTFGNFSWISRSGNSYGSTVEIWNSVLENVVGPMKSAPLRDLKNFNESRDYCETILNRLDNLDYLVEAGINDKFIYSVNGEKHTIQIGDTNVVTMNNVVDRINRLLRNIEFKYLTLGDNTAISLASPEFLHYRLSEDSLLIISDYFFKIERGCSIRDILGFKNLEYESTLSERTGKYFIIADNVAPNRERITRMLYERKLLRMEIIMNDFTKIAANMGYASKLMN